MAVILTYQLTGVLVAGNFTEDAGAQAIADIAFFHHRVSLAEIYDEMTHKRQQLVKECCGALRDVCDFVFSYDAAKVTLFYEKGALSRFVRQKLLFNVAPVEERKREKGTSLPPPSGALTRLTSSHAIETTFLAYNLPIPAAGLIDVRTDPFVYAYFYGLCVHKLAHFFDVVHGTRHDFYMVNRNPRTFGPPLQLTRARFPRPGSRASIGLITTLSGCSCFFRAVLTLHMSRRNFRGNCGKWSTESH